MIRIVRNQANKKQTSNKFDVLFDLLFYNITFCPFENMQKPNVAFNIEIRECVMYQKMKDQIFGYIVNLIINLEEENIPTDNYLAKCIKTHCDQTYGPPWHCFVGRGFGSSVTYKNKHFLYMYIANRAIQIYKH